MRGASLLGAVLILIGCRTAMAASDPIQVVVVGPQTGEDAGGGQQEQLGARAAIRDLNVTGLLGRSVRVEVLDDACDFDLAVAVAQKIAAEHPDLVIGHGCSTSSLAAAPIYAAQNVLQIVPDSTNPEITERGIKTIFRMIGRDDRQAMRAAQLIAKRWRQARIAVLDDGSVYGQGLAEAILAALQVQGIEPALRMKYAVGELNFHDLVSRLSAAHADVIYVGGFVLDIALMTQQLRKAGLTGQIIAGDTVANDEFVRLAGQSSEGVLFTFPPDLRRIPAASAVVAKFRADGFDPAGYTLLSYAAVQVWAEAVNRAGTPAPSAVAAALRAGPLPSVIGNVSFDAKGDIVGEPEDFVWYAWHAGKAVAVTP